MVDLEAIELNFDGITYAKGASVVVQLVAFVGQEAFLEGLRAYFAEHAFGNTELGRPAAGAGRSLGPRPVTDWSGEWLETAGVNTLNRPTSSVDRDGHSAPSGSSRRRTQDHPTLRSHRIAVGLYARDGNQLKRVQRVEADISGRLDDDSPNSTAAPARPTVAERRRPELRKGPAGPSIARRLPWTTSTRSAAR